MNKLKICAFFVALICVIVDLITKMLASSILTKHSITAIDGILKFEYCENRGAAFGILADKRYVFMILSCVAIAAIVLIIIKLNKNSCRLIFPLALILGGGIGNMIDRIRLGYVVDFLHVTFIDFPIFNVADIFVTIGSALALIFLIFDGNNSKTDK